MHLASTEIREASVEAAAEGIRRYLPEAIGVVVVGIPICLLAAFAHFVLGTSSPVTTVGASAAAIPTAIRRARSLLLSGERTRSTR